MPSPPDAAPSARLQEWSNVNSQLLWTYRGPVHPKGRDVQTDSLNLFAWLLMRGTCSVTTARGTVHAGKGEWMLPPFGPRHQKFSSTAQILSVCFRAEWPGGQSLYNHGAGLILPASGFPELEHTAIKQVGFVEREFPDAGNQLFLQIGTLRQHLEIQLHFAAWLGIYSTTLAQFGIQPSRPLEGDTRIARALQFVERHALNLPFREAAVASEAGISVAQLHRLFVRQVGKTPRQRFEERRQQVAVTLVEQSQRPLKVISADLGFSSPSHFSRWFASRLNSAPRTRRKELERGG